MRRFVGTGDDVIIKPNICAARAPQFAATTNPVVVATLVRLARGAGASRVRVMDNPISTNPGSCYSASGISAAVKAAGGPQAVKIDDVLTPPWFIPESTVLFDQLEAFRARHEHFAIVVDEYGALRGIVTLEDIIEEIVGDIEDEHDAIKRGVVRREDGSMICLGEVPIRDLNREFGWNLPQDVAITIAGLVLHEARRIPEVGQTYAFYGFRFDILKREGTRIAELRIVPPDAIQAG